MAGERFVALAAEVADAFQPSGDDLPRANLDRAIARGVPALTVPVADGGLGANLLEFARYQARLARGDGATALILAMHHMLIGGEAEAGLWPHAEWAELCRAAVDRGALVNSAATEPGSGSPSFGGLPQATAEPDGGAWRVSGRKAYTTGAPALAFVRVSARVSSAGREPFGARFLVRLPEAGVTIDATDWEPIALRAAANHTLVFDGARATFLYPETGRGCEGTVWFQVAVAATYLGIGQAAYEAAADQVRTRRTGTGPLRDIESVRLRLGRLGATLMVARQNLFATCAGWLEQPPERRPELVGAFGLAKVVAVNAAADAAADAIRLAGAVGLGADLPFGRYLAETRAGLSHPPVDDVAYLKLAADELGSA